MVANLLQEFTTQCKLPFLLPKYNQNKSNLKMQLFCISDDTEETLKVGPNVFIFQIAIPNINILKQF